jgi:signal transduction histidine kinase
MARVFVPAAPRSEAGVRRFLIGLMVTGFVALIAVAIATAWLTKRNQDHSYWVEHTYRVEQAVSAFRLANEQIETARRGYILTGEEAFVDRYRRHSAEIGPALDRLAELAGDNAAQVQRIRALRALSARVEALRDRSMTLVGLGNDVAARRFFATNQDNGTIARIRSIASAMAVAERSLLTQRNASQQRTWTTFLIVLAVAGVLVFVVAVTSLVTVLRYTRDLGEASAQLRELNESLEGAVAERTADLTRANEEIQRFAYIVSHDLRSPLVNVMGFTAELEAATKALADHMARVEEQAPDLADEDARVAANEDLPEAIGFIRTSTQKMDALINAILKLSREGRRVIAPEPIDMDALVENIRDTLQHRLDEREASLIVHHPLPKIVSDRLSIDQIFSNLIENAVKYLDPKRPGRIEVRGRREGVRLIYEIADNGRGIDPRDHARVFDLFRRSGAQDQPGEGIGLAHVRALVYRLGGIIDVSSQLGEGATFQLSLPIAIAQPQERSR